MTKRAAVIGYPVAQSLSPKLHNYWLKTLGIDGEYSAQETPPAELKAKLQFLKEQGFQGCNLTVPHKEAALAYMDELDITARKIGAVNTVVIKNNRLIGSNTDAYGFMENLREHVPNLSPYLQKAVVIGAGGAARAVVFALTQEGCKEIVVINRTEVRAEKLAADFEIHTMPWEKRQQALAGASMLINTTTQGMTGNLPLDISLNNIDKSALVADIVYKPLLTPLLEEARIRGNVAVDGIGMLIHQAVPGFQAWFGKTPAVTAALKEYLLA